MTVQEANLQKAGSRVVVMMCVQGIGSWSLNVVSVDNDGDFWINTYNKVRCDLRGNFGI